MELPATSSSEIKGPPFSLRATSYLGRKIISNGRICIDALGIPNYFSSLGCVARPFLGDL